MAFVVGLLLAPVGAIIGSVLFFAVVLLLLNPHPPHAAEFVGMTIYGIVPGLAFATPVTALALPLIYAVARRRGALNLKTLTICGALCGMVPVLLTSALLWWTDDGKANRDFWAMMVGVAAEAAFIAALCAVLFGWTMRALRPEAWDAVAEPAK